ncbi:hypothetical protein OH77DRAFT_1416302 [Trametes cingulata]|nr:hypothetical protein OH77DRAFT_1416302 [Trametes cingulata]
MALPLSAGRGGNPPSRSFMSDYHWSLVNPATPAYGRTFTRRLGVTETSFYYDRVFNGTADLLWQYRVEEPAAAQGHSVFTEENINRTWATLKQYYPLLGSRMELRDDDSVVFVVQEHALLRHQQGEVTIRTISSAAEVEATIWRSIRDKPIEDHHVMARVFVFAHTDKPGTYDVLFKAAHAITDGIAGITLARTFFDVLCSPPIDILPLEERLAVALPLEALNPALKMNLARQRWRRAIGKVTFLNMRRKLAGGHAMPRTITEQTFRTPAVTRRPALRFSPSETRAILDSCRRHRVTFGSVIHVISQMALTRLLHRRYLRGDISEEEWEQRRRQPLHSGGPLNLRPYLDEDWQRKGGLSEILLMIDYYDCTLPFMPTPYGSRRDAGVPRVDGAPPYSALLSRERFFYRAKLIRQQITRAVKYPLVVELAQARQPVFALRNKMNTMQWQAAQRGEPLPQRPELQGMDAVAPDYCFAGGFSSVGDVSPIFPSSYPLPASHPLSIRSQRNLSTEKSAMAEMDTGDAPATGLPTMAAENTILQVVDSSTFLHSRPTEFFLGNSTTRDHINLTLTYDGNVYLDNDADEYMRECREATLYYLAGEGAGPRGKL